MEENNVYVIEDEELGEVKVKESALTRRLRARDERKAVKAAKLAAMSDEERKEYKKNRIIAGAVAIATAVGAAVAVIATIGSGKEDADEALPETCNDETESNIVPFDTEWTEIQDEAVSE